MILGDKVEEYYEKKYKGMFTAPVLPPEYKSGIGDDGVEKINEFAENGGTVIALYDSCEYAIEKMGVRSAPVEVPAAVIRWLCTADEAIAMNGENIHAQPFCKKNGILPGWP